MPRATPEIGWSARNDSPEHPYDTVDEERIVKAVEGNKSRQLSEADRQQLLSLVRQVGRAFLLATCHRRKHLRGRFFQFRRCLPQTVGKRIT